ncbi:MAG: glycosyltransferase, partial [Pseudomonadota bacterium]
YDIDAAGRAELFRHAQRRVVIDDMRNNGPYAADLLINPNPGATEYAEMRSAVGADYVLLRREILGAKAPRDYTGARNILISCGGSDPSGAAQVTLDALQNFTNAVLHIRCIAGPFTAPSTKLDMALHSCEVIEQTTEMQQHLNWADIAILAAGSTLWEAAYLATPMLAIVVADNQMPGTRAAADAGALMMIDWRQRAVPAGLLTMFTEMHANQARRASFAEHAAALIDGLGAERAAQQIAQIV